MLRTLAYPPNNGATDEFVDDSEPERADIRKKQRKSAAQQTNSQQTARPPAFSEPHNSKYSSAIIEISDDSDSEILISPNTNAKDTYSDSHSPRRVNEEATSSKAALPRDHSTSQIDDGPKRFDLNRFAFPNPVAARKAVEAALPTHAPILPGSLRNAKIAALDISLSDLARISRCVCCDFPWTARKTSIQKMAHIRSCAKKHKFNDDTVQILVRKEVTKFVPTTVTVKKGKEKEPPAEDSPSKKTYMEDILVGVAPRKKTKRKETQTQTHVANILETRTSTLHRARLILSSNSTSSINHAMHSTEPLSKLIRADDGDTLLRSTQPFGKSSLGQLLGATSKTLFSATSPASPPSRPCSLPVNSSPNVSTSSHNLEANRIDGGTENSHLSDSSMDQNLYYSYAIAKAHDRSGAISIPTSPAPSMPRKKSPKQRALVTEKTPGPTKALRAKRTPSTKARSTTHFDEKWESHMMKYILQDTNLHMRILRYEPIDFNVFLGLAQHYAPINGRLKLHLRKYLDKKAIHFYEASR